MKFVLLRHAHKGLTPFEDPELSIRGFEQSAKLLEFLKTQQLPVATELFVSPRRRTSQTLYPISKELTLPMTVTDLLDQRKDSETAAQFRFRIARFIKQLAQSQAPEKTVYACTHYDWIEEAMSLINCDRNLVDFEFSHWAPAQHLVLELLSVETELWSFKLKGQIEI
jgi:broad specificity phosphatase PhoE